MPLPENEVAADNQRRKIEAVSESPVGGVIESVVSVARPALTIGSALVASGRSSATELAVAGSVVAGLGIVDWFRKLGNSKVNENLESLGQATEDALKRAEETLREHGTSIDEIKARIESQELKDGMVSAALQALRTTQTSRLKRMASILANGVKDNELESESLDDMMRAAAELKQSDLLLLRDMYDAEPSLSHALNLQDEDSALFQHWQDYWDHTFPQRYPNWPARLTSTGFGRLAAMGLIYGTKPTNLMASPVPTNYRISEEGKKFHERLQPIGIEK
jgi:hypothetical protein